MIRRKERLIMENRIKELECKLEKYQKLENKLQKLCIRHDDNIVEHIINIFIERIFKGIRHEGFIILTNEEAAEYDEYLKIKSKSENMSQI